jgi:hypothetical protein
MPHTGSFIFAPEELEADEDGASGDAPSITKPEETGLDEIELAGLKYLSGCALNFCAHPPQQK